MSDLAPILIVDDSADDVELFQLGLASLNLANPIDICRDGVQALDYLLRRGPFADRTGPLPLFVLLDIKMPRMDGIETLTELRRQPGLEILPVIMMTSSNQPRDIQAGYAAGANGFVVKPVGFEKLVESAKAIGMFWGVFNQPPLSGDGH
ncbi:MAG: response regulator [Ramlibacter sp.]|nr:response regulator [Ramlibacter sp.]